MTTSKVADETISNEMKTRIKFEGDAGIIPEDIFKPHVDPDFFDALAVVQQQQQKLTACLSRAFGEGSIEHMQQNPDINSVSGEAKFGTNAINLCVRRQRTYPAPANSESKEPIVVYGDSTVGVRVSDDGSLRATREHLKDFAKRAFGNA
ncbi:MAG: hypothetical protein E6R13_04050 [Spirochaetes bacterium]|nr:MAG: hypothetical protein E6R13_04050 [Spirochaetota bacterium]